MARKLTPEEIERNKTDFDIPAGLKPLVKKEKKPTTKKATSAKKPAKKPVKEEPKPAPMQTKHPGGRPRKSEEKTDVRSFRLPERTMQRLRILAAVEGVSPADIIIKLADRAKMPDLTQL